VDLTLAGSPREERRWPRRKFSIGARHAHLSVRNLKVFDAAEPDLSNGTHACKVGTTLRFRFRNAQHAFDDQSVGIEGHLGGRLNWINAGVMTAIAGALCRAYCVDATDMAATPSATHRAIQHSPNGADLELRESKRIRANPFDHRSNPVGALRRKMLFQPQFIEGCHGVGGEDFVGSSVGVQG
jgi:hypothetical protein